MSTETINVTSNEPKPASTEALSSVVEKEKAPAAAAEESDEQPETTEASETSEEEQEEEGKEETEEEKPKKPLKGFKKRINKLNERLSAKEQEAEYWKRQALEGKGAQETKPDPKVEAKSEGKPKAEDFESHEDFVEALADWKTEQKLKERESKQRETQAKTEHQKQVDAFQQGVQALMEKHEDFEEVLESVDDVRMSPAVQQLILDSKNGPELTYHLAKNREELERICKLSPLAAARELGKFEAGLSKPEPKQEPRKLTKAPEPIKPLSGSGKSQTEKTIFDEGLSQADFEALEMKRLAKKRA